MQVGERALAGQWEYIGAQFFEITEHMAVEFKGELCNIMNSAEEVVQKLRGKGDGEVFPGWQCVVIKGEVKFTKMASA